MSVAEVGEVSRVTVRTSIYARTFGEEVVLLDFGCGEYFALDPVGARVFSELEKGNTVGLVADAIASEFDVERPQALRDIVDLVEELRRNGLVDVA